MSQPSKYGKLKHCPSCGVASLKRDHYPDGPPEAGVSKRSPKNGVEYVCETCGFGFEISKSRRVYAAEALQAQHRKLRNGVTFKESCVGKEIAAKYLSERKKGL